MRRRRSVSNGLDAWPGYVDALSTLLMVIIFVLLVFVLGQAFLSVALSGRNQALSHATQRINELADQLGLAQSAEAEGRKSLAALRATLAQTQAEAAAALTTLKDQNATQAAALADAEAELRAGTARELASRQASSAQIDTLNQQLAEIRAQLKAVSAALDTAQAAGHDKDAQIATLGTKLNSALAARVEELQRYRSEFFGKLRDVLANRPGIQVVGDRFVFQSEVLFPVGSADITSGGQEQIRAIAATIKQIAAEIPPGINWVLRVDGHADKQKLDGGKYASNWELSSARAIGVVKLLITEGVPADHLAATGFADNQPLVAGDTPDAYAKNRRIELRLTDR
jgi:chemotaxis protein MotB